MHLATVLQTGPGSGRPPFIMGFLDFSYKLLQILSNESNPPKNDQNLRPSPLNFPISDRPIGRGGRPAGRPIATLLSDCLAYYFRTRRGSDFCEAWGPGGSVLGSGIGHQSPIV